MPITSSLNPGEIVKRDDPRFFNMGDLAQILGVDRGYIRRMKAMGFRMPMGRASVEMAHNFIETCEDLGGTESAGNKRGKSKAIA